jgi:hypothetical protein
MRRLPFSNLPQPKFFLRPLTGRHYLEVVGGGGVGVSCTGATGSTGAYISGSVVPTADNVYTVGSSDASFRSLFAHDLSSFASSSSLLPLSGNLGSQTQPFENLYIPRRFLFTRPLFPLFPVQRDLHSVLLRISGMHCTYLLRLSCLFIQMAAGRRDYPHSQRISTRRNFYSRNTMQQVQ